MSVTLNLVFPRKPLKNNVTDFYIRKSYPADASFKKLPIFADPITKDECIGEVLVESTQLEPESIEKKNLIHWQDWKASKEKQKLLIQAICSIPDSPYCLVKEQQKKICFYGGSFNPWHRGHQQCLENYPGPEHLCLVIDNNPQKILLDNPWDRFVALQKQIAGSLRIFPGFLAQEKPNPTYKWIHSLKTSRPELDIGLLMGEDSFLNLAKWINYESLLNDLDQITIVPRGGKTEQVTEIREKVLSINPKLKIHVTHSHPYEHLSSTQIRETKA